MPSNNELVTALPAAESSNHALLRAWGVKRVAFCLTTAEDSRNFVMTDPDGAGTTPAIIQNGRLYSVDLTDTTTAHDGILTLVSYDALRYKIDDLTLPYSVLDKDLTAPPGSPAIGATYLIYGTPTGAWVGKSGYITRYCSRGWEFALPPIGFRVLVEDENSYYFRNASGNWVAGLGSILVGANSIPVSAIINAARTSFIVENQTTNAPPGSPSLGVGYIVGPSPTGAWAGKAAQIAVCEDSAGGWSYYVPANGFQAYDKSLNAAYRYTGSVWISASGSYVGRAPSIITPGTGSTTAPSGDTVYTYSNSTAPTTSVRRLIDAASLSYIAKRTGAQLVLHYACDLSLTIVVSGSNAQAGDPVIALFRDSETNAVDWKRLPLIKEITGGDPFSNGVPLTSWTTSLDLSFEITAADTSSHTYKVAILSHRNSSGTGRWVEATTIQRRRLALDEAA